MPPGVALGVARFLANNDRIDEGMDALALVEFEDGGKLGDADAHERAQIVGKLIQAAFSIATRGGAAGVSRLLDTLARRQADSASTPGHPAHWKERYRSGEDMSQRAHQALVGQAFRHVASQLPESAVEMAARAPAWMCLHQCPSDSKPRHGQGLSEALRGAWPLEVSRAYFERDGMVPALLVESDGGFRSARKLVHALAREFDPELDARAAPHFELFLRMALRSAPPLKENKKGPVRSPLPNPWMSALCLGGFKQGREMLFEAYGRELCLEISRAETSAANEISRILDYPQSWALEHALDLFGPHILLKESEHGPARSAVSRLARSQSPEQFARSLDLLVERGAGAAISASCAQRFWVIQEGQSNRSRKQGDALAYCAAEGLVGQAEALLARFPDLDRKPARETLAYMGKRGTEKHGPSLAAWESLVLREIGRSSGPGDGSLFDPEPPAPARRKRL